MQVRVLPAIQTARSSNGSGHHIFDVMIWVRIPYGLQRVRWSPDRYRDHTKRRRLLDSATVSISEFGSEDVGSNPAPIAKMLALA